MSSLKAWWLVPFLLSACTDDAPIAKGDDPFEISNPGKADGTGLLSAADQQRLEAAFDAVVTRGQATIAKLEQEIAKLETDHTKKQQEADALVTRIAAREQELRDNYNRNIFLCALFPNPATCLLANYLANDSTLSSYKSQLEAARAAQRQIAADIASYRAKRDDLRTKITSIRQGKERLLTLLRDNQSPQIPAELASSPETGRAYWRADVMGQVETAIGDEIALLVELRNAAVELAQTLDQSINTLRALEQSVDQLVERSRKQFMDLAKALLSGDPTAHAERWLETELASRTRMLLNSLRWPLNEFARFLVETDGTAADAEALIERILRKLVNDAQPADAIVFSANTAVNLLDNTVAKSPLDVTQTRTITSLEVFVDITHTYVGDLEVALEHGGEKWILSNQVGGNQQSLVKTFRVDAEGLQAKGRWTLVVADKAAQDTGKLNRWQLLVR